MTDQDIAADIERLTPGVEYHSVDAIYIWGQDFKIGEIRFSNAMTTTRNSLMPGSFGQIAYRETWSGTGGSPTPTYGGTARGGGERRWLSYNHIGNVVNTSNDTGALVESIDTDAYGNPLANVMTGAWGSSLSERGLTTKELDTAAGMYYFYQRWYDPTTATFASRAPYPPMMEHGWGYALNNPVWYNDPRGMNPFVFEPVVQCFETLINWRTGNDPVTIAVQDTAIILQSHNNDMGLPSASHYTSPQYIGALNDQVGESLINAATPWATIAAIPVNAVVSEVGSRYGDGAGSGADLVMKNRDSKTWRDVVRNSGGWVWDRATGRWARDTVSDGIGRVRDWRRSLE